jgi:integrase
MPKLSNIELTQKFCVDASIPERSAKTYRCSKVRGLALKVSPTGKKTFVFCYSNNGRERRTTIGEFGTWTLARAKKQVFDLRRSLDQGMDPLETKREARSAPTITMVWNWYTKHFIGNLSESHKRDLASSWENAIIPFFGAHTKLRDLSKASIQAFVDKTANDRGDVSANRYHSYLRSVLGKAKNDGWIVDNPASGGIRRNPEYGRERHLSQEEFQNLSKAMEKKRGQTAADAIAIMMFTGARKTQVLKMKWDDLDLVAGVWIARPSSTKSRRPLRVQLNTVALDVLANRQKDGEVDVFVFPGPSSAGYLKDVRKTWNELRQEAKIDDCRLHDLRHTFASFLVSGGKSLELIGAMLGHSQMQTTKRYSHLKDAPLKEASESIANLVKNQ